MPEINSIGEVPSSIAPAGNPSNSHAFTTQGQISWTSLANSAFSATVGVLSRVSAAGVDPYTIVVGQKLGAQFQMTSLGRWQMIEALRKLPLFQSIGTALCFGFGVNHLVRIMGKTEEGQLCLALCASLVECYDMDPASEVLVEMVRTSRAPESLQPSVLQWIDLLRISAGILVPTTFPEHAEKLMALHPSIHGIGYGSMMGNDNRPRGCSSPKGLAQALLAVGQITFGSLTSITIVGNADAGWIAAFAEWHFQLSVQITLASTGAILYQSHSDRRDFQILVIYEDSNDQNVTSVQMTGRTYRLVDITGAIRREHDDRCDSAAVAGRVAWRNALITSFGSEFKMLLDHHRAFSGAIGCLARIMKAICMAEDTIHMRFRQTCKYYETDSYGRGFIASLTRLFPEVVSLRDHMEEEAKHDVQVSLAQYEAYISALKIACNCTVCKGTLDRQEKYCLGIILEAIVRIARTMTIVDLPISLNPSRLGIEFFYQEQVGLRIIIAREELENSEVQCYRNLGSAYLALHDRCIWALHDVMKLFCSRLFPEGRDGVTTSAVSSNGICAYWSALGRASNGRISGRITIIPGQIELHGKAYRVIHDTNREAYYPPDVLKWSSSLSLDDMSVVVKQTMSALKIHFEMQDPTQKDGQKIRIMPASAILCHLQRRGHVPCGDSGYGPHRDVASQAQIKEVYAGHTLFKLAGVEIEFFEANVPQQWILLNSATIKFWVERECLDCTLAAALSVANQVDDQRITIIRPRER